MASFAPYLFDGIVLLLVLGIMWLGFKTGIMAGLFFIASGFGAMAAAHAYAPRVHLNEALFFLVAVAVLCLVGYGISRALQKLLLKTPDRVGGALLGLCIGALAIVSVVMPASGRCSPGVRKAADSSYTGSRVMPWIRKELPWSDRLSMRDIRLPRFSLPRECPLSLSLKKKSN